MTPRYTYIEQHDGFKVVDSKSPGAKFGAAARFLDKERGWDRSMADEFLNFLNEQEQDWKSRVG